MKKRPTIVPGDIVRFSKKGKQAYYPYPNNIKMIVVSVDGIDSSDSNSKVVCRVIIDGKPRYITAFRNHLWFSGRNIFEGDRKIRVLNSY